MSYKTDINSGDSRGVAWAKMGAWADSIALGGGPVGPSGPAGPDGEAGSFVTPTAVELTDSRDLVDGDSGLYLYNTGGAKTLTIPGEPAVITDNRFEPAVLDWAGTYGTLGYWLVRTTGNGLGWAGAPVPLTSGIGAGVVLGGSNLCYGSSDASFYNPNGSPNHLTYYVLSSSTTMSFTLTQSTRVRIGIHYDNSSARTLRISTGSFSATAAQTGDANFNTNPKFWSIDMPAGDYVLDLTRIGDNPGLNGVWFDPINLGSTNPLSINDEVVIEQASTGAVTISAGNNTLLGNGVKTSGVGTRMKLKKAADGIYHLFGDVSAIIITPTTVAINAIAGANTFNLTLTTGSSNFVNWISSYTGGGGNMILKLDGGVDSTIHNVSGTSITPNGSGEYLFPLNRSGVISWDGAPGALQINGSNLDNFFASSSLGTTYQEDSGIPEAYPFASKPYTITVNQISAVSNVTTTFNTNPFGTTTFTTSTVGADQFLTITNNFPGILPGTYILMKMTDGVADLWEFVSGVGLSLDSVPNNKWKIGNGGGVLKAKRAISSLTLGPSNLDNTGGEFLTTYNPKTIGW